MTPREIDALVAEKVMGWKYVSQSRAIGRGLIGYDPSREMIDDVVPNYSTDIAAAWEVVEKLTIGRERFHYNCLWRDPNDGMWTFGSFDRDGVFGEKSDTAPLAICLAALKAVGVEVEPTR